MRTLTGKKLVAVWRHPHTNKKIAAYERDNIPELFKEYGWISGGYNKDDWKRISGLWSETEGIIE